MVTLTCPQCASRQQIDSLLNHETVNCGNCHGITPWFQLVNVVGEVLCACPACGTKLRIESGKVQGSCTCPICKNTFLVRQAPRLVGPGIHPPRQADVGAPVQVATAGAAVLPVPAKDPIERLVNGLVAKEFTFVSPDASPEHMQARLTKFDEGRLKIGSAVFKLIIGTTEVPGVVKTVAQRVVSFTTEAVQDQELAELQQLMHTCFPLSAFSFSKMYGPRFVTIVDGDMLAQQELLDTLDRFEHVNLRMLELGSRVALKVFGKAMVGLKGGGATGSMILLASTPERAAVLRSWLTRRPLQSDTIVNQLKERAKRPQFWIKAVFGFIEYKPYQLRQEVVVMDLQTGQAVSSVSPRLAFEFGFSMEDIA